MMIEEVALSGAGEHFVAVEVGAVGVGESQRMAE